MHDLPLLGRVLWPLFQASFTSNSCVLFYRSPEQRPFLTCVSFPLFIWVLCVLSFHCVCSVTVLRLDRDSQVGRRLDSECSARNASTSPQNVVGSTSLLKVTSKEPEPPVLVRTASGSRRNVGAGSESSGSCPKLHSSFVAIENFADHLRLLHRHTFRKKSLSRNIAAVARTLPSTSGLSLCRSLTRLACASSKKKSVFFQHSESVHDLFKFVPLNSVSAVCQSTCF